MVTGAGLVGCQIAQRLIQRGERPVLFDVAPQLDNIGSLVDLSKVKVVRGDVLEPLELIRAIEEAGVDRVIHTAVAWIFEPGARIFAGIKLNIMGTVTVLEAARLTNLKRVVFTSSNTVYYGAVSYLKGETLSEDFPIMCLSGRVRNFYPTTKICCEQLGLNYYDIYGVDFVAVRFARVFGPFQSSAQGTVLMKELVENGLAGRTVVIDQTLTWPGKKDFVYSKDAAQAAVLACYVENPKNRIYNISMGQMYTVPEVIEIAQKLIPRLKIEVKERSGVSAISLSVPQQALDISKAREELKYEPEYKMEKALRDYRDYIEGIKANTEGGSKSG